MIVSKAKTGIVKAQLPNGMSKSGYVVLTALTVENNDDAEELNALFSEAAEISCVVGKYVFIKQFQESKVDL